MSWMIDRWMKERMFWYISVSQFIEKREIAEFELYFIFYLWAAIEKNGISRQVSIIFKMTCVI